MTTAHSSTTLQRTLRREAELTRALLRLRWSVAASALGRDGRSPVELVLEARDGGEAALTVEGVPGERAQDWLGRWDGRVRMRRATPSSGPEMLVVDASPLAVVVFVLGRSTRPLHVSSELPEVLGLAGGRYELVDGAFSL